LIDDEAATLSLAGIAARGAILEVARSQPPVRHELRSDNRFCDSVRLRSLRHAPHPPPRTLRM